MRNLKRGPNRAMKAEMASTKKKANEVVRCAWSGSDPLYVRYHDEEWGVPLHDDRRLFEMLILEGAQAGLSWITVLRKRESYRRAYRDFDPVKVARFTDRDRARLLADEGIVRNRAKVDASIGNAKAFLALQREHGSFDAWLWAFVDGKPIVNHPRPGQIKAKTELSDAISKALKKLGFKFVGSTIVYAFMQAVGMVDDHVSICFRAQRATKKRAR